MSTHMSGWIEVLRRRAAEPGERDCWDAAADIGAIEFGNAYDLFGCLFGVRNRAQFRPIAPERGLPDDVSDTIRSLAERWQPDDPFGATWIGWPEIQAIDLDEPNEPVDTPVQVIVIERGVGVVYEGDAPDGSTGRAEPMTRREVLDNGSWQLTCRLMAVLADFCGDDAVRLVVWFSF